MSAEYPPEKGKFSYKWVRELIESNVNPYGEDGFEDVVEQVIYHLRHLGLINEEKIHFDEDGVDE